MVLMKMANICINMQNNYEICTCICSYDEVSKYALYALNKMVKNVF